MAYQALRRMPQSRSVFHLVRKVAPLAPPLIRAARRNALAKKLPPGSFARQSLEVLADRTSETTLNRMQDIFFAEPGLDTLLIRALTQGGLLMTRFTRARLWFHVALGLDAQGRAAQNLKRIPRLAYDSLMLVGLAAGKSLGYFRGGAVHSHLWWDSLTGVPNLPAGHPLPQVRRFQAPQTLGDMAADIDDLYWAEAYGQVLKITMVGTEENRRWLVSLPGTDHPEPESQPNPADLETNMREELNIPSAMRLGVIDAIHNAMDAAGISRENRREEKVLICGHSQGGIVAVALAAAGPEEIGFTVSGVITLGSPTRRHRIGPDVTMLAVEHDQDVVPTMDGTPRRQADQRVVVHRSLIKPRVGSLYYAHSSSTYTDTLRWLERRSEISGWGRQAKTVAQLQRYLPQDEEETWVSHHYVWQEVVASHAGTAWDTFVELNRHQWEPVLYGNEIVAPAELAPLPQEMWAEVEKELGKIRSRTHERTGGEGSNER